MEKAISCQVNGCGFIGPVYVHAPESLGKEGHSVVDMVFNTKDEGYGMVLVSEPPIGGTDISEFVVNSFTNLVKNSNEFFIKKLDDGKIVASRVPEKRNKKKKMLVVAKFPEGLFEDENSFLAFARVGYRALEAMGLLEVFIGRESVSVISEK